MKGFLQRILQEIMKKIILGTSDAWSMRRLSQRPSVLYWRLSNLKLTKSNPFEFQIGARILVWQIQSEWLFLNFCDLLSIYELYWHKTLLNKVTKTLCSKLIRTKLKDQMSKSTPKMYLKTQSTFTTRSPITVLKNVCSFFDHITIKNREQLIMIAKHASFVPTKAVL